MPLVLPPLPPGELTVGEVIRKQREAAKREAERERQAKKGGF